MHKISVTINGAAREAQVESRLLLVHLIREVFRMTGTPSAATPRIAGRARGPRRQPVKSCTVLAVQADGSKITTVEAGAGGKLHPCRRLHRKARPAMRLLHAGMLMTTSAFSSATKTERAEIARRSR